MSCQGSGSPSSVSRKARGTSAQDVLPQSLGMMLRALVAGRFICTAGRVNSHLLRLHRVMKLGQVAYPDVNLMGLKS
jgi:hypothetical protein